MKQYVHRMICEKEDLENRIKKAIKAIETDPFGMNKTQKMMLAEQIKHMQGYLDCLEERIQYETVKDKELID